MDKYNVDDILRELEEMEKSSDLSYEVNPAKEDIEVETQLKLPMTFEEESIQEVSLKSEIFDWIKTLVVTFAVVFFIFGVLMRVVTVDGVSMFPTLNDNDVLLISNVFYEPSQSDIVVISDKAGLNKNLIKRIIATEGQTLDIIDGEVTVNGFEVEESYVKDKIKEDFYGDHNYPVTVPDGYVFVMGDNRNNSLDSRYEELSFVRNEHIKGRVILRLLPLKNIGIVD